MEKASCNKIYVHNFIVNFVSSLQTLKKKDQREGKKLVMNYVSEHITTVSSGFW